MVELQVCYVVCSSIYLFDALLTSARPLRLQKPLGNSCFCDIVDTVQPSKTIQGSYSKNNVLWIMRIHSWRCSWPDTWWHRFCFVTIDQEGMMLSTPDWPLAHSIALRVIKCARHSTETIGWIPTALSHAMRKSSVPIYSPTNWED